MGTHLDIVGDLDLVIYSHVVFEDGIADRATVNGGVGANFTVVSDPHCAQLRYLDPMVPIKSQAKAI